MAKVGNGAKSCFRCPLCRCQGVFFVKVISNRDKQVMATEIKVIKVTVSFGMSAHDAKWYIFKSFSGIHLELRKTNRANNKQRHGQGWEQCQ